MTCFAMVVAAAAWSVAAVLAVVSSVGAGPFHTIAPWLLIALSVGVTATLCLAIETSREKAMRYVHAELEGEVTERHLSII